MQINSIHQIHHLQGHKGAIYTLAHGIEVGTFLSAGSDGLICKWNPVQNQNGLIIAQTGERIFSLLAFPERKVIFAGTMQGDLFHLNFQNEQIVKRFKFHQPSIYRLAEWNDLLIVAAGDGIISNWNPENGDIINHLKISHQKLRSLAINKEADILYVGDANGNLWIHKLPDLKLVDKIENLHDKTIFSLEYLENEKLLISGGLDAHLKICDYQGKIRHRLFQQWHECQFLIYQYSTCLQEKVLYDVFQCIPLSHQGKVHLVAIQILLPVFQNEISYCVFLHPELYRCKLQRFCQDVHHMNLCQDSLDQMVGLQYFHLEWLRVFFYR